MRDHVCIAVADRAAAERFYDRVLATLAFAPDGGRVERDPDGNTISLDEALSSERLAG